MNEERQGLAIVNRHEARGLRILPRILSLSFCFMDGSMLACSASLNEDLAFAHVYGLGGGCSSLLCTVQIPSNLVGDLAPANGSRGSDTWGLCPPQ